MSWRNKPSSPQWLAKTLSDEESLKRSTICTPAPIIIATVFGHANDPCYYCLGRRANHTLLLTSCYASSSFHNAEPQIWDSDSVSKQELHGHVIRYYLSQSAGKICQMSRITESADSRLTVAGSANLGSGWLAQLFLLVYYETVVWKIRIKYKVPYLLGLDSYADMGKCNGKHLLISSN